MNRREFLRLLGLAAAAVAAKTVLPGCDEDDNSTQPEPQRIPANLVNYPSFLQDGYGNLDYTLVVGEDSADVQAAIDAWALLPAYDPCVDFNHDGIFDYVGDIQILIDNWGTTLPCP